MAYLPSKEGRLRAPHMEALQFPLSLNDLRYSCGVSTSRRSIRGPNGL